jgi:tRNA nucleotidyltransferase (CCA-adding enzyme)
MREASLLLVELPVYGNWKPSQWTFHLDAVPSLAVYAVWLATSESALQDYLMSWQNVNPITTGDELKKRGLEPGPKFKHILTRLRAAWLDGEVETEEEEKGMLDGLL